MSEKHLEPQAIRNANVAGNKHAFHFVELNPKHSFVDLFMPQFWGHYHRLINENDLVRVKAHDGAFDVMLAVAGKPRGGLVMELWPKYPGSAIVPKEVAEAAAVAMEMKPKLVPFDRDGQPKVRVEWTKNTEWRVRGIDGHEVSRDHKTEAVALGAMQKYMDDLGLIMPSQAEIDVSVAASIAKAEKSVPRKKEKAA